MRPYELDITRWLRPGRNPRRVDVTNLLINKLLGNRPPDYSAVYAKYGNRFWPGNEWETVREPLISASREAKFESSDHRGTVPAVCPHRPYGTALAAS